MVEILVTQVENIQIVLTGYDKPVEGRVERQLWTSS